MTTKGNRKTPHKAIAAFRHRLGSGLKSVAKWASVAAVWGIIAVIGLAAWYAHDLPDVDKALAATRQPTITVLAANGVELATLGDLYGKPVTLKELPPALPQAVIATEDRRYYSHFGLDIIGLVRAAAANISAGRIVQGGSTITQQVAKNLFLTPERTIKRKAQELLLALWLERKFNKDQILTVYLNRVYLGNGVYGVQAAAGKYFGLSAQSLSTYQAALLAGLLKAPSRYNPIANSDLADERTGQVLANMVAAGYLSRREADSAKTNKGNIAVAFRGQHYARHFTDWVMEQVSDYVSPGDKDIVVITTLDADMQRSAEAKAKDMLAKEGNKSGVAEAALVAMTPDGAVRAMVGGREYELSQFNRAVQSLRQPGSAFKPFVYLAGLEAGMTPETRLVDTPLRIEGWSPKNFVRHFEGEVSMSEALARSINTVAVQVAEKAGRNRVIEAARRLGITSPLQASPSLALGSGEVSLIELTAAYAAFANGGYGVWPHAIEEIRDVSGHVLYRRLGSGPGRVMSAAHAAAMNAMLSGVITSGTGHAAALLRPMTGKAGVGYAAVLMRPAAGKTGTSQNFRDAWFVGYSAELVAGVWMGNDDGHPMKKVTGGGLPAQLWRGFMEAALADLPPSPLPGLGRPPEAEPAGKGFWDKLLVGISGGGD